MLPAGSFPTCQGFPHRGTVAVSHHVLGSRVGTSGEAAPAQQDPNARFRWDRMEVPRAALGFHSS